VRQQFEKELNEEAIGERSSPALGSGGGKISTGGHGGASRATKPGPREVHGREDPMTEEWRSVVWWNGGSSARL
jgi:hypothetical protein